MKQIELENWEKSPDNPYKLLYAGQREAQEVFAEIQHRLEAVGMLPDEYFLLDCEWRNGREIPKDADIFCTVEFGGSEGIYLNVSIAWHEESNKSIKSFATGKTLGESEYHLDRMYLTASAVNKALYSNEPHARYMQIGDAEKKLDGTVLNLNVAERQLILDSLIEMRNNEPHDVNAVEQLLRRVTGSITEYVNETGARPLQISAYDTAVLAIQDGNLAVFNDTYKKTSDKMSDLLITAAARPGKVGLVMTGYILQEARSITSEAYLTACKNAISAGSTEKTLLMADKADKCVADLDMSLYGEIISTAMSGSKNHIAHELVKQCTPEQIKAAHPYTLAQALYTRDTQLAFAMAEKKIDPTHNASDVIRALKHHNNEWMLKLLYERGMEMNPKSIQAMQACIDVNSTKMGQALIDRGMNFEQFEQLAASNPKICEKNETFTALSEYWKTSNPPAKSKTLAEKMLAAGEKVKAQDEQPKNSKSRKREERE